MGQEIEIKGVVPLGVVGASAIIDCSRGNTFTITLGADATLGVSNLVQGHSCVVIVTQDLTGGRSIIGWTAGTQTVSSPSPGLLSANAAPSGDTVFVFRGVSSTSIELANSTATASSQALAMFGNGADGDAVVSAGTTTLSRDMYYRNLTVSGTGQVSTAGFRIFVSDTLDITAAPADAITRAPSVVGGSSSSATGGSIAGTGLTNGSVGGSSTSTVGANGGTTNGNSGSSGGAASLAGGACGASGKGGNGGSGTGGAAANGPTFTPFTISRPTIDLLRGATLLQGGYYGGGGGGGAGDGTTGFGGGASGAGGGVVAIFASRIMRGAGTSVGAISAVASAAGNGGTPAAGSRGGGGGGGGAGGGWVYIVFQQLLGASAVGAVNVSGGAGGNGGSGTGAGTAGDGGTGGGGGRLTLVNVSSGSVSNTIGTVGSGPTGQTGGPGETLTLSL